MIAIYLQGGKLDTYEQDIETEYTNFRFREIADNYTNDFTLPKTNNNIRVLQTSGLLDSTSQPFSTSITPAAIQLCGKFVDARLQVVEVRDDEIEICLYETTYPDVIKNKNVNDLIVDDSNTIYPWNVNTLTAYPNDFLTYNYGMHFDSNYAQRHPSKKLNDIIDRLSSTIGFGLPHCDNFNYVIAGKKTVCPQNQTQYIEGYIDSDGVFVLSGGQHITNDMRFDQNSDVKEINFNRSADVTVEVWVAWKGKTTSSQDASFTINHNLNGQNDSRSIQIPNNTYFCRIEHTTQTFHIQNGSIISFSASNSGRMDGFNILAKLTITNYQIEDEDYGEEMQYIGRAPRLVAYDWNANRWMYFYFDASRYICSYRKRNTSTSLRQSITTLFGSFAWFGYYCNLNDFTIAELLCSLQWVEGKKIIAREGQIVFAGDESKTIDGAITATRPSSEYLGKTSVIALKGGDIEVCNIENDFLEDRHPLLESIIAYCYGSIATYKQYSNPQNDDETKECDFEDVEGLMLCKRFHLSPSIVGNYLVPLVFSRLGFDKMTQSVEVEIETLNDELQDADYVFLDGRKYMVVNVSTDLNTRKSNITALLVPTE